jgi:drug/metabolite transporter (DMT)-like permease
MRNIFEGFSMGINFTAIQMIPLSTYEIILNFKGIMGTIISHFYLKERMTISDKITAFVGLIGMILVVKPSLILGLFYTDPEPEFKDSKEYCKLRYKLYITGR